MYNKRNPQKTSVYGQVFQHCHPENTKRRQPCCRPFACPPNMQDRPNDFTFEEKAPSPLGRFPWKETREIKVLDVSSCRSFLFLLVRRVRVSLCFAFPKSILLFRLCAIQPSFRTHFRACNPVQGCKAGSRCSWSKSPRCTPLEWRACLSVLEVARVLLRCLACGCLLSLQHSIMRAGHKLSDKRMGSSLSLDQELSRPTHRKCVRFQDPSGLQVTPDHRSTFGQLFMYCIAIQPSNTTAVKLVKGATMCPDPLGLFGDSKTSCVNCCNFST